MEVKRSYKRNPVGSGPEWLMVNCLLMGNYEPLGKENEPPEKQNKGNVAKLGCDLAVSYRQRGHSSAVASAKSGIWRGQTLRGCVRKGSPNRIFSG